MSDIETNALPSRDIQALSAVVGVFLGELWTGHAPADMVDRMIRRMIANGVLPAQASAGELGATLHDLITHLHYALGVYDVLPPPAPREIWRSLRAATEEAAVRVRGPLIDLGSREVVVREVGPGEWEALAAFPDLPPDPAFTARTAQLTELAEHHGLRYAGWQQ